MEVIGDFEADGLHDQINTVWCAVFKDSSGKSLGEFTPDTVHEIPSFISSLGKCTLIIHNGIDYDIPHPFSRILGGELPDCVTVRDTFILSQLLYPDRRSHSLESFGEDFGYRKVQNEDWSQYTPRMLERCSVDVDINVALWNQIKKDMATSDRHLQKSKSIVNISWDEAVIIEHQIAHMVAQQGNDGCPINNSKLSEYIDLLSSEIDQMYSVVSDLLGFYVDDLGTHNTVFLASGGYRKHVISYWGEDSPEIAKTEISGPYTRICFERVKLSQHQRVKQVLLNLGWTPTSYTEKGSPKLPKNEEWDDLAKASGNEGLSSIAKYGSLKNRLDILRGWKDSLRGDGTIRHSAFTCGTPTARFRHSGIVNIPRATISGGKLVRYPEKQSSIFGTEMRELICCPYDGWSQVGWDLSGIELRMLAHYMNDSEFFDVILNGDVHTFFWEKVTNLVADRSGWKNVFYGFSYGAGNAKLGSLCTALPISKRTAASGKILRDTIESSTPSLGKLVRGVQKASERGFLRGIDGRKIYMKKDHRNKVIVKDALNRLLQSGAAIVFKKACCILEDKLLSHFGGTYQGIVQFLIFYHDETQAFVRDEFIEQYSQMAIDAVREAGEYFNLNIRLDADVMVGTNWAECH